MERQIGPLNVEIEAAVVAALKAVLGLPAGEGSQVPWIYPARWLAHPAIREEILALLAPGEVPLHESQQIAYSGSLAIGMQLVMHGAIRRETSGNQTRLIIDVGLATEAGEIVRLRSRLLAIGGLVGAVA